MTTKNACLNGSFLQIKTEDESVHGRVAVVITKLPDKRFPQFPAGNYSVLILIDGDTRAQRHVISDNEILAPDIIKQYEGKIVLIEKGKIFSTE